MAKLPKPMMSTPKINMPKLSMPKIGQKKPRPIVKNAQDSSAEELDELQQVCRDRQRNHRDAMADQNDGDFIAVLVFQSREQKLEAMQKLGLANMLDDGQYIDGMKACRKLGVNLTTPVLPVPSDRVNTSWNEFVK